MEDLTYPKLWTIGEAISEILSTMPLADSADTPMFNTVTHGFTMPDKQSSGSFPLASILPPVKGEIKTQNGVLVDYIEIIMPVYAYFKEDDPKTASLTLHRFIQEFMREITDRNHTWFDESITVMPKSFAMGDVLKELGFFGRNKEILPPFYGVHVDLSIRINDSIL